MTKLRGLIRLFRMELPLAAGICVLLGELLVLGKLPTLGEAVLGFASVFFLSASALIINDVFDLEADKVNAPERPLPSGAVKKAEATALFVAVTLLGLAASAWISGTAFIAALIVWAVGFLYNWRAKRWGLAGNVMVALSVSMTFIFGGIAVGRPFEPLVWLLAVTALLIDLGEEIAADAMDAEGDREIGSQSLALVLGKEKALRISGAIFYAAVASTVVPFVFGWLDWVYLVPTVLMDAVILYCAAKVRDPRTAQPRVYIRWLYLSASLAMMVWLVMRLVS